MTGLMLNEYQRRRVSITLSSLEEDLHDIEERLKSGDYTGILYEMKNDMSLQIRDFLIDNIAIIREKISNLAERFSLRGEIRMLSREIYGEMSVLWVSLEETKARRLRGYGEVAKGLADLLDPALDEIIALLDEIRHASRNV